MTKRYYTIRFERDDTQHRKGDQAMNADNLLSIGQVASCDIRLDNPSQYEDAILAIIKKRPDEKGWKLIRTSPFKEHEVRVNGAPIDYVHFLSDGDRIAFEGQRQELTFNIREDDFYTSRGIMTIQKASGNRPQLLWMAALTLVLGIIGVRYLYTRPLTDAMIEEAKHSVFQIKVDSIQLVSFEDGDTIVHGSCGQSNTGIAFLTTDSLLITARHCIEPWLNIADNLPMDTVNSPLPVKWALKSVTHEILGDSIKWKVISYCSVYQLAPEKKLTYMVKSTDFHVNASRDQIVEYGDYKHQYFWRSISVRPRRTDMMLGDIAYLPVDTKGDIRLASKNEMQKICSISDQPITILGCPEGDVDQDKIESSDDKLRKMPSFVGNYPQTVIAHNGSITSGFSGGPVLTKYGFRWYAIGVVSVTDKKNNNRCYSVPVTEIEKMKGHD